MIIKPSPISTCVERSDPFQDACGLYVPGSGSLIPKEDRQVDAAHHDAQRCPSQARPRPSEIVGLER